MFPLGLALLVLMACVNIHSDPPHPLYYTDWSLAEVRGQPASGGAEISFLGDSFDGYTGCNSFEGRYREDAPSITVTELLKTERGCPTDTLFRQEQAMIEVLASARRYKEDGSRLVVMGRDGVLVFER